MQTFLELLMLDLLASDDKRLPLIAEARDLVHRIRTNTVPLPKDDSIAYRAFDPHVARQLNVTIPIKAINLSEQEDVWTSMLGILDGFEEMGVLSSCENLLAWDVSSSLVLEVQLCSFPFSKKTKIIKGIFKRASLSYFLVP